MTRADEIDLAGTTLRSRTLEYQSDLLKRFTDKALNKIFGKLSGGEGLDLVIHKVYNWENIVEAHTEMEEAKNVSFSSLQCTSSRL